MADFMGFLKGALAKLPKPPLTITSDHGVSRARRAIFAFIVTMAGMLMIAASAAIKVSVDPTVVINAQHVVGDIATFIGVAYISGSVVDYRSMMKNMAGKYGVNVPFLNDPAAPDAAPAAPGAPSDS